MIDSGGGDAGPTQERDAGPPPPCTDGGNMVRCGTNCVDTSADTRNCGGCGNPCDTGALCCDGVCVGTGSCSFAVTSVYPTTGWQNGGSWVTLEGAGFANGMKAFIADGRCPLRVVDPTKAIVQLPPGPLGKQDVRITAGAQTATLPKAFTYETGGLDLMWQQKPLAKVRGEDPGIAVMQDGRVLVAGGTTVPDAYAMSLDTAEIYDRTTDTVTPAGNAMSTPRWQNAAVTLLDGRVLVVGGACYSDLSACVGNPQATDLFDPKTNTFSSGGPLALKRAYPRAVLLVDGRVFVSSAADPSVEIFDPTTNTFSTVQHTVLHTWGFVVRLRDGRVLIGGGDGGNTAAEVFDGDTNTFTSVGPLAVGRSMLTAHTLPDGRVIVIGGASMSAGGVKDPLASMEVFDPGTNKFTTLPYALQTPRCWHASALVRDGTVLVMGGYTVSGKCDSSVASVEQVDPVAGTVMPFQMLLNTNTEWTAATLLDGSVLGVGGGACGTTMALPDIDFLAGTPG